MILPERAGDMILSNMGAFMNNRYMLIKILERDVSNDKLEEYKEYLSKPVLIETKYGDFELDRSLSWFSTDIELFGFDIFVSLETDEDNVDNYLMIRPSGLIIIKHKESAV